MYTSRTSSHTAQEKFDRFEQWLRDNGAKFEMLELREYDDNGANSNATTSSEGTSDSEEKKETAQSPSLRLADSEQRGVHAVTRIPPNTVCMSIPRACLITVEMGQATPIGQAVLHSDLDLDAPKHIFLMIYILWDRKINGDQSFFHPYYEILPPTLRTMPIFWTRDELAMLEGSYLVYQIHDRNQAIADDYHAICQIAPTFQNICNLEEFKWARMCVCSRNFGLQMDGHRTSALVPHADMLNHRRPRATKWTFDEELQAFTITTLHQTIAAGAQVYDSYGQKCCHRFLLNYGFAPEDNRELDGFCPNEVPLELYVDQRDDLFDEKVELWTRGETSSTHMDHRASSPNRPTCLVKRIRICVSNNENTRLVFSLLRALACNRAELNAINTPLFSSSSSTTNPHHDGVTRSLFGLPELSSRTGQATLNGMPSSLSSNTSSFHRSCRDIRHPISIRNERAAMYLLLDVIDRHLAQYPTSLSQDLVELMDERSFPQFSNKRHAKIQVRGEKEVLHHYAQWARTALDVLNVIEEELNEERDSVEVQLTGNGRSTVTTEERPGFEYVMRRMEEDVDNGIHHTIVRFCADVLGSLRREEFKNLRKQRAQTSIDNSWANRSHATGRL